ncbi:MAG: DUF2148 domain-containing protein [Clostridiales Family XIII bacterium]|nr:DUF2148 domain-containing protein [Clostridiales Family XIII bacterium]
MIYTSSESEKHAILEVAHGMVAVARTAPKACGIDNIETFIVDGEDKDKLSAEMRKLTEETGVVHFGRDGSNVDASECVVFIGVANKPVGLQNCALCGFEDCGTMAKAGGRCALNIDDLGIATGAAVAFAADHRIDNRIMYTAGKAALRLGWFSKSVTIGWGIPLSALGKSPYFDRK